MSPVLHDAQLAPASVAPHSEQNFPEALAPHLGHLFVEFSTAAVMRQS
jgi:hypothetical protein